MSKLETKPKVSSRRNKKHRRNLLETPETIDWVIGIIMLLVIIVTLYPFLNVLALSLNDSIDASRGGIHIWPRKFTFDNYIQIWEANQNLLTAFRNSVLRTVIGTAAGVFCCAIFAYVISRRELVFRRGITIMLVITMYVSGGLIPGFILIREIGLYNNFLVYIIPMLLSAFNVIVIRSFIDALPAELDESARLDGAGHFRIFWQIVLPLAVPAIATIALFLAVGQWNSWFDTYIYVKPTNYDLTTLQFELQKILSSAQNAANSGYDPTAWEQQANKTSPQSIKMAITIIATVPILMVYPFVQKYFVSGLTLGAVKN